MYISRTEEPGRTKVLELGHGEHGSQSQRSDLPRGLGRIAADLMLTASIACALLLAACVVGPKYARPSCVPKTSACRVASSCTRDEGRPLAGGDQEPLSNYRVLLSLRAMVVSDTEKAGPDPVTCDSGRRAQANC